MADPRYHAALEAKLEEIGALQVKLVEEQRFANMLATMAGEAPPFESVESQSVASTATVRSDQFANYGAPSEAARAFLAWRGQAKGSASLDAVFDALEKGGFIFGSTKNDAKGGLRIALGKDNLVHRLPNGTYGLREWYPNARKPVKKGPATRNSDDADDDTEDGSEDGRASLPIEEDAGK
jgi:hypothetical protein